jgi:hypothetical protein
MRAQSIAVDADIAVGRALQARKHPFERIDPA